MATEGGNVGKPVDKPAIHEVDVKVPRLSQLRDGMSILGASRVGQSSFNIKLNSTFSTFDKKFEVALSYVNFTLPERKVVAEIVSVTKKGEQVTTQGFRS